MKGDKGLPNNYLKVKTPTKSLIVDRSVAVGSTRVACLYRVSTIRQVDLKNDIPLQETACKDFAEQNGWTIIKEYKERGVSGYKTPAAKRDVLQEIKVDAEKKKFDILLVFMFDRLGRREDETPFVLQWFIEHGIRVWSVQEGEQRLDEHVDKLTNYIRFWQASGESGKTSIRVKKRREQLVEGGAWGGGPAPYGYRLVHNGRINKYRRLLYDLEINEEQAKIVKTVFEKTIVDRMGRIAISNYLNTICPSPSGNVWKPPTIAFIQNNSIYTGRIRSGEVFSNPIESLRIISDDDYHLCLDVLGSRNLRKMVNDKKIAIGDESPTKAAEYSATLLNGLLVCGSCGKKLRATFTQTNYKNTAYYRPIYRCMNSVIDATGCTGQRVYSAKLVDSIVLSELDDFIRSLGNHKLRRKKADNTAQSALAIAKHNLTELMAKKSRVENEVLLSLIGKSGFDSKNLNSILSSINKSIEEETAKIAQLNDDIQNRDELNDQIRDAQTDAINLHSEFQRCSGQQQNYILRQLINRIEVFRANPKQPLEVTIHYTLTERELHPQLVG